MLRDETCEKGAIDAPRDIMTGRNGEKCARVVIKADRIIKASRFRRHFTEASHSLRTVVEPPGRAEPQARVVPRKWRKFSRVCALIQGEQNDRQSRIIPETIEERLKRLHIFDALRDVGALVATKLKVKCAIMISERARVNLHHHSVLDAHGRKFSEHLRSKEFGVILTPRAADDPVEQCFLFRLIEVRRAGARVPVISRGCAERTKICTPPSMRSKVSGPACDVLPTELAKSLEGVRKVLMFGIDDGVRTVGGDHLPFP